MTMPAALTRIRRFCGHLAAWARPVRLLRTLAYHLGLLRLAGRRRAGLHLGCGPTRIRGFLNVDRNPRASSDVIAGIERVKLRAGSVETLYASHVFEHVPRQRARAALQAWHQVLAPGGKLYLLVPDLEALCRIYAEKVGAYDEEDAPAQAELAAGIMFGGQADRHDFHYFGYAFATLRALLTDCGFRDVQHFDRATLPFAPARDGGDAEIEGTPVSLNVEATA